MRAQKRLRVIADLINDNNCVVADIGADHGYLSKMLIEEGRAKKVFATDISASSLDKTNVLIKKYNLADKIETRVGDGLKPIKDEVVDVVVIAGMGGNEIIKILQANANDNIKKYIFQPVQNTIQLRQYFNNNHYEITKDFIVKDQEKFYNTIEVVKSKRKKKLSKNKIEFGLTNFDLKSKDFYDYLINLINKQENILRNYKNKTIVRKIKNAKKVLKRLYL